MPSLRPFLAYAVLSMLPGLAGAQQCAGLTDVLASNQFCANIAWIKNRGVTQGCAPGLYCPTEEARRDQMAAFMSRLGKVLTPQVLYRQDETGPLVLPTSGALIPCQTDDTLPQLAPVQYPRQASVLGILSARAGPAAAAVNAFVLVSADGGASWTNLTATNSVGIRATAMPNAWLTAVAEERVDLAAGTAYRFALGFRRDDLSVSTGDLVQARCQLTAVVSNRNPTVPPL